MDKREILKWIGRICIIIVFVYFIIVLSDNDKYGEGRVSLTALAVAGLLFCIGKLLLNKK
jgi:hypothetical protein